ncbi:helix-turn-helix transcriptional regulator [Serratia aquatilis]|uniref:Helix-turn-helix transcriptional regulator n=1 Tax=Serratia aquatilis TaxID=1737515 RepID=A0ABV6EAV9_9GAMM
MKEGKSFYLQHACAYTREGIDFILRELSNDLGLKISSDSVDLQSRAYHLWQNKDVDFFILGLQGNGYSYGTILDIIINQLPLYHPQAKVVIMAQANSIGRLKHYLSGLRNVITVLDYAISIEDLRKYLQALVTDSLEIAPRKQQATPLTYQEIKVLRHLLKGMPVLKVARTLEINQKTVSGHKRSALNKLGIPSLHGLMKCGNDTHMMNELLRGDV